MEEQELFLKLSRKEAMYVFDILDDAADSAIDGKRELKEDELEEQDDYINNIRDIQFRIKEILGLSTKSLYDIRIAGMRLKVELNGTDTNPYEKLGTTQNPFPQIAKHELAAHCLQLQKLGGPPIPQPLEAGVAYINEVLKGWSDEFIELCIQQYKPGELVKFYVNIPDEFCK